MKTAMVFALSVLLTAIAAQAGTTNETVRPYLRTDPLGRLMTQPPPNLLAKSTQRQEASEAPKKKTVELPLGATTASTNRVPAGTTRYESPDDLPYRTPTLHVLPGYSEANRGKWTLLQVKF